jgi:fluoride exporter
MTILLVAVGAAVGAPARYLLGLWLNGRAPLPWGTFTANVAGSLLLGFFARAGLGEQAHALLGTGFCGAFTTYSTFAWETHTLLEVNRLHAATYALGSLAVGVAAGALGWWLGGAGA